MWKNRKQLVMATGTLYRKIVWFSGGISRYTRYVSAFDLKSVQRGVLFPPNRGGYQKASRNFDSSDLDVDVSG